MQNSPAIPIVALVVATALAIPTMLSVIAAVVGGVALSELQLGGTAWALALGMFGLQGIVAPRKVVVQQAATPAPTAASITGHSAERDLAYAHL